jgi:predicted dehydrogenase
MREIGIGLIGSGFMGKSHSIAFHTVGAVFPLAARPRCEILADADAALAATAAAGLGFARSTGDWKSLLTDPAVDLVDITAPNLFHKPMALAAAAAGKHVYCEKPLALDAAEALAMAEAVERAGVKSMVGFNYLKNPILALARDIVASGEIGEVIDFRGIHAEDYMASPAATSPWRLEGRLGSGAVADLGSHIISMARFLVGPIAAVNGVLETVVKQRPRGPQDPTLRPVEIDDQAWFLLRFAGGAHGTITASWVATGRKMQLAWELTGTKGSLAFTQERLNELKLYTVGQPKGRDGYKTIVSGPDHPPYGNFCVAPAHELGFNDLKVIEVRDLLQGIAGTAAAPWPDFREGYEVQRVVDAVATSHARRGWVEVSSV